MAIIWHPLDEKRLATLWEVCTVKRLAKIFGKSEQAIRDKGKRMGLKPRMASAPKPVIYSTPSMPFVPIGRD